MILKGLTAAMVFILAGCTGSFSSIKSSSVVKDSILVLKLEGLIFERSDFLEGLL